MRPPRISERQSKGYTPWSNEENSNHFPEPVSYFSALRRWTGTSAARSNCESALSSDATSSNPATHHGVSSIASLFLDRDALRRLSQGVPDPADPDDAHVPQARLYFGLGKGHRHPPRQYRLRLQCGYTDQALRCPGQTGCHR